MKTLISFLIGLIAFAAFVYFVDGWVVKIIVTAFPPSAQDWITLIRIATWLVVLWATFGVCALISYFIAAIVMLFLSGKELKRRVNKTPSKSKWQERLEEMQNRRNN